MNNSILYILKIDDTQEIRFDISLEKSQDLHSLPYPEWTKLAFRQCSNCPLTSDKYSHCPAALDIKDIAGRFSTLMSHGKVDVTVITKERSYSKRCDVQTALSSLFGLVLATSACPVLSQLKSMAAFHLPFASLEETIFRTAGTYLLKQYFLEKSGKKGDFTLQGLKDFYEELQTLNIDFSKRIKAASQFDANINAIIKLFVLSESVSFSLEERLEKIKGHFYEE